MTGVGVGVAAQGRRRIDWREVRPHVPFLALLGLGALLRVLTTLAYRPAMEYVQDSFSYLWNAHKLTPDVIRPVGYSFLLKAISVTGHLTFVPIVQHGFGLAMGVLLYALLVRLGARPWVAAIGAAPVLLDGYQVYVEQFVLAEAFFEMLVVGALALLLAWRRPPVAACVVAGAMLGLAAVTRTIGVLLIVPVLAYLVVTRVGWQRLVAAGATAGLVLAAYAGWYDHVHGHFALGGYDGYFLAGRVAPFAECGRLDLPAAERALCDDRPPADRTGGDWFVWNPASPLRNPVGPSGPERNRIAGQYARDIIRHQPGDYLRTVMGDVIHYFAPGRWTGHKNNPVQSWQFRTSFTAAPWHPEYPPADPYVWAWTWPGNDVVSYGTVVAAHGFDLAPVKPRLNRPLAELLHRYQRVGYTPGPLLALAFVLAVAGAVAHRSPQRRHVGWGAVLLAVCGVVMVGGAAATAPFDYRYLLPSLVILPSAGVLGASLVEQRARERRSRSQPEEAERPTVGAVRAVG
jgi:hypothetical protein